MKVIAAISAILLIPLAAMFGMSLGFDHSNLVSATLLILLFVAGTSLVLGVVFGRTALRITTICGGLALCGMWLPLQYYATEESLMRSAIALLLAIVAQVPMFYVGGVARSCIAARLRNA